MPNIPPNYTLAFDATFAGPLSSHITSGFGPIVSPTQWITHTPNATDFGSSQFGDATGALNPYTVNASNQLVINCFSQGFVQGDAALTASTTTCTLQLDGASTAGDCLVVSVFWQTSTITGITDSAGNSAKYVLVTTQAGNGFNVAMYIAPNIAASAQNTITISWAGANGLSHAFAGEYSNIIAVSPIDVFTSGTGTTSPTTMSLTPVTTGAVLVGAVFGTGGGTVTKPSSSGFWNHDIYCGGAPATGFPNFCGNQFSMSSNAGANPIPATYTTSPAWLGVAVALKAISTTTRRTQLRSGLLSSMDSSGGGFTLTQGYWECRCKVPQAYGPNNARPYGVFPSFWLNDSNCILADSAKTGTPPVYRQVNSVQGAGSASMTISFNSPLLAGSGIVVVIGFQDTVTNITSVGDAQGNGYGVAAVITRGTGVSQAIFITHNVLAAGANGNVITIGFDNPPTSPDIRILEYAGVSHAVAALDGTASLAGTGTAMSSGAMSTTLTNSMLVAATTTTANTQSAGSGFNSRVITANGNLVEDRLPGPPGSYTGTATQSTSGGQWVMQMIGLRPVINVLEIDIFEMYGVDMSKFHCTTHNHIIPSGDDGPPEYFGQFIDPTIFHVWGCWVQPDFIHYYLDGVEVSAQVAPPAAATHALFCMIDFATGGGWDLKFPVGPNVPDNGINVVVDYIRAYAPSGATVYPAVIDSLTSMGNVSAVIPGVSKLASPSLLTITKDTIDQTIAVQNKVGTTNSAVLGSIEYRTRKKPFKTWIAGMEGSPQSDLFAGTGRNGRPVLIFPDAVVTTTMFFGAVPLGTTLTSGVIVTLKWMSTIATAGAVVWGARVERMITAQDSDSFGAQVTVADTTAATAGTISEAVITIPTGSLDGLTGGDPFALQIQRVGTNASDNIADDAQLQIVSIGNAL